MGRRYILEADTGIIRGMTEDDSFVHTDPAMVAVVIPPGAARRIQAGGHWNAKTQTYTQSEQSRQWETDAARRADSPPSVDPEWQRNYDLFIASQTE